MVINYLGDAAWQVLEVERDGRDIRVHATPAEPPQACPRCGHAGIRKKGVKRKRLIMDVPRGLERVGILAPVRSYACANEKDRGCGHRWDERLPGVEPGQRMTTALFHYLRQKAFHSTFTRLADETGLSPEVVRKVFAELVKEADAQRTISPPPKIIGVDEVYVGRGYRFVVANVGAEATLLDMLPSRKEPAVRSYFEAVPWRGSVEAVVMDMWRPYEKATRSVWPEVAIIADKFHVLQGAAHAVEACRLVQANMGALASREFGKGYRYLRRRRHALDSDGTKWLARCETEWPLVAQAFEAKEGLYEVYNARDRASADDALVAWEASIPRDVRPYFGKLTRRIKDWRGEVLAYFDVPATNAATERLNGLAKLMKRLSPGLSFELLRGKLLFGSPQVHQPYRWGPQRTGTFLTHGAAYTTQGNDDDGNVGTAGTDLDKLLKQMKHRSGGWGDPGLWRDG